MQKKSMPDIRQPTTAPLIAWLKLQRSDLADAIQAQFSEHTVVQGHMRPVIEAVLDGLSEVLSRHNTDPLYTLLRTWAQERPLTIGEQPESLLPLIGVIKHTLWHRLHEAPLAPDLVTEHMRLLDGVLTEAGEYLVKIEAAALFEEISHHVANRTLAVPPQADEGRRQSNFLSIIAHELKTPLTVIEGYTDMLKLDLAETASQRSQLMLQGIDNGLRRLQTLIENMIGVSLIEMNLLVLEPQPVWLRRLLGIAAAESQEALNQRHLTLEIQQDTIPAQAIIADPEQLLEALQNVLENAIKYTPDGGKITISGVVAHHFVDIMIQDTGIGIAPEDLDRIFLKTPLTDDISRHSSGRFKFKGGGPGLGLTIAKGIVEAHGGTIWAESAGQDEERCLGSCFHIMLPLREAAQESGVPLADAAEASQKAVGPDTPAYTRYRSRLGESRVHTVFSKANRSEDASAVRTSGPLSYVIVTARLNQEKWSKSQTREEEV